MELTFAHVLETSGGRCRLRGTEKIQKRYFLMIAAYDLGIVMRMLFGIGTSRSLQGMLRAVLACFLSLKTLWDAFQAVRSVPYPRVPTIPSNFRRWRCVFQNPSLPTQIAISSTGC